MAKEELRSYWLERYNEFKKSGQSKAKWCRDNKINLKTFCNWYTKYNKQESKATGKNNPTGWLSINVKDATENTIIPNDIAPDTISMEKVESNNKTLNKPCENSFIVVRIGKASIELNNEFDKNLFFEVAKILGELC